MLITVAGPPRSRHAVLASALTVVGALALPALAASPAAAADAVAVTVNAAAGLGTVPSNAIGLNTAVYDGAMNDAAAPGLLKTAGINALRYPGGSYSDIYDWQTNVAQGGYVAPNTNFADFMATAQSAGASPIITVNYGTGTPALAASWVQEANVTHDYGIKYWEVGNEVPGNGTYGANWEADAHCDTSVGGPKVTIGSEPSQTYDCGPTTYAGNVLSYMSAMKAVDPHIHVCAVLTTPGSWPDGVTTAQYPQPWNQTVLTALGAKTDCLIVHYYPANSSMTTAQMLATTTNIPGIVSAVKSEVRQYAGLDPADVPILITETDNTIDPDTMPAALFAADVYMSYLEGGVVNVDWWDQHNGPGTPGIVDGAQDYGDGGMFSSGGTGGGVTEPPLDTPFASYYGVEMLTKLEAPGDEMVGSDSGNPLVRVHAVRKADGSVNVLIDNEDPANTYTADLAYTGFTPSGSPTVYTLANNGTSITSATQASASSVTVAPYTLTVVHIPGGGGGGGGSACAVHYAVGNSWPGGFGANITVTNQSAAPINGWKLTFTWPDSGEAVGSGWNGTWSQSGANVTVTNAGWNATLGANGGSAGLGFNGTDTGQDPAPTAFYLNGTACSNN